MDLGTLKEKLRHLDRLKDEAAKITGDEGAVERHRRQAAERSRRLSRIGQDIGPIPAVKDWPRRLACKFDLQLYLKTYLGYSFHLPFSPDHTKVIRKAQRAVLEGGLFAEAMPRGTGKTEIVKGTCTWAINYGHRRFVLLIGATNVAAQEELLDGVRFYYENADLFPILLEDFPELVYPVLKLDGEARKQGGQRCQGTKTGIHWGGKYVVMPTVPPGNWIDGATIGPSPGAGAFLRSTSITGRVRGYNVDGRRPDFVIPDDPQTDESAASVAGNRKIERILSRAVLGLGGPGRRIAGVMPCTVIEKGDAIDSILTHALHPEWDSERTKMLNRFPTRMDLWEQYRDLRNNFNPHVGDADKKRAADEATLFYLENHDAMQVGAAVAWPERFFPDELDGLQRAMNFFFDDREAFFSEGQNDPLPADLGNVVELTPDQIVSQLSHVPRGIVPHEATALTAFVDVQAQLLFWMVCAWKENFTGWVVDYGTWPEQGRPYWTKRDASKTLAKATGIAGEEGQLNAGLTLLTTQLLGEPWKRENGEAIRITRLLIDSGYQAKWVYEFVRQQHRLGRESILPSKGRYVGAGSVHLIGEGRRPGDKSGFCWHLPLATVERSVKLLHIDTNAAKSHVHARLAIDPNQPESLSLFGSDPQIHRLLADHLTAEYRDRKKSERTGREVDEWYSKPGKPDNDFFDCLTGCATAASLEGIVLKVAHRTDPPKTGARKSWAKMKKRVEARR